LCEQDYARVPTKLRPFRLLGILVNMMKACSPSFILAPVIGASGHGVHVRCRCFQSWPMSGTLLVEWTKLDRSCLLRGLKMDMKEPASWPRSVSWKLDKNVERMSSDIAISKLSCLPVQCTNTCGFDTAPARFERLRQFMPALEQLNQCNMS